MWQLAVLVGLCVWAFRHQLLGIVGRLAGSSEAVHGLVAPVALILLGYRRRGAFAARPMRGSPWGIGFVLVGLVLYAAATWPFQYGYARDVAVLPALAGAVLVACGWRALRLSLPLLLLLLLSIPVSTRLYLSLVIRPEAYTLSAVARFLRQLPGIDAGVFATDIVIVGSRGRLVLGFGGSRWASGLLMSCAAIGVFVTFCRFRPVWRIVLVALLAAPLVFFCNFLRLLCWALIAIYTGAGPTSGLPRNVSAVVALAACYGLFLLVSSARVKLFIEEDAGDEEPAAPARPAPAPAGGEPVGRGRGFLSPRFVASVVILASAGAALRPAMRALAREYRKGPIAIRRPLRAFDASRLASFREGWKPSWFEQSEEDLRTREYACIRLTRTGPSAEARYHACLSVMYYSEAGGKVPHSPEVCCRQAGATVTPAGEVLLDVPGALPDLRQVRCGVLLLDWPTNRQLVLYTFCVEGRFVASRGRARWLVARPGNRRTFHSLIMADAEFARGGSSEDAMQTCKTLLREALPILVSEYFPDREQLRHR